MGDILAVFGVHCRWRGDRAAAVTGRPQACGPVSRPSSPGCQNYGERPLRGWKSKMRGCGEVLNMFPLLLGYESATEGHLVYPAFSAKVAKLAAERCASAGTKFGFGPPSSPRTGGARAMSAANRRPSTTSFSPFSA